MTVCMLCLQDWKQCMVAHASKTEDSAHAVVQTTQVVMHTVHKQQLASFNIQALANHA